VKDPASGTSMPFQAGGEVVERGLTPRGTAVRGGRGSGHLNRIPRRFPNNGFVVGGDRNVTTIVIARLV